MMAKRGRRGDQRVHTKGTKDRQRHAPRKVGTPFVPLVFGLLLLVILVVGAFHWYFFEKPVETTLQSAVNVFRSRNVSEMVLMDLAGDFANHTLTLRELEQKYPGFEEDIRAANDYLKSSNSEVLASVNGVVITRDEFARQMALLPAAYQGMMTEDQILHEMIDEELLLQEAARLSLMPSLEEIEEAYQNILTTGQLTEKQLEQNIAGYGLTREDLRALLKRQLTITKLFNERVEPFVNVTDEEALAFYEKNKQLFVQQEQVTVRHILVATAQRDNMTALARAEEALAKYEEGTDFCSLVLVYSDDGGSKENCGEYTFGRNVMVPEFEQASFAMKPRETRIVKTSFGYHVILKTGETPMRQLSYGEVASLLLSKLAEQRRLEVYQAFISGLEENATIVNNLANAAPQLETVSVEPMTADATQ